MRPLFNPSFLVSAEVVKFPLAAVVHLGQIVKHPGITFPHWSDVLNLDSKTTLLTSNERDQKSFLPALQMEDLVAPDANADDNANILLKKANFTVEIKPKQGFYQIHKGMEVPFCQNCVLQMEKTHARAFDTMYEFCPLNFFSGNLEKLRSSLFALLRDPHRNLRIFQGPSLVYSNNDHLAIADLERLLFPKQDITISTFVEAICYALAGVSRVGEPFRVSKQSVLESLLRIQKLDTIGIVQAYKIFSQLPDNVKEDLDNNLFDAAQGLSFLEGKDALSLLQQYLLAATVKDCSLMMNITPLAHDEEFKDATASEVAIAQNGADIRFAVSVKIVDLDPKLTKHILSCYKRFAKGVELIKANPGIHKRCVFHPVL